MTEISTKLATYTVFCACVLDQIGILGTGDKYLLGQEREITLKKLNPCINVGINRVPG